MIKVCGMRDPENIRALEGMPVDMVGMEFCNGSLRYVPLVGSGTGMMPDYSRERLERCRQQKDLGEDKIHTAVKRVGVFEDNMPQTIMTRVYNHSLDYVQLQGQESPVMIQNLLRSLCPDICPQIGIIKAFHVSSPDDFSVCKAYEGVVNYFLFKLESNVSWNVLSAYQGDVPFLIGGSVGPDDVQKIRLFRHPRLAGFDLDGGFEVRPGLKDVDLLCSFLQQILLP